MKTLDRIACAPSGPLQGLKSLGDIHCIVPCPFCNDTHRSMAPPSPCRSCRSLLPKPRGTLVLPCRICFRKESARPPGCMVKLQFSKGYHVFIKPPAADRPESRGLPGCSGGGGAQNSRLLKGKALASVASPRDEAFTSSMSGNFHVFSNRDFSGPQKRKSETQRLPEAV